MRVFVPGEGGARDLFALAAAERVQVRHLRPSVPTLEDVFATRGGGRIECRFTTRAIGATRGTRRPRRPGVARHRARPGCARSSSKKAFLGLLLLSWLPFFVRAVQIYAAANFPQARRSSRATPETFRQFLDQQDIFVFFVTVYVGAGLIANDRRANALQIYLSKPLTRVGVHRRQARRSSRRSCCSVTWVPAIVLLIAAGDVRRQLRRSSRAICICFPRSRCSRFIAGADGVGGDARAVVAVEQQPLRRRSSMRR